MAVTHIYLSPHLDDAALSCGGAIWKQTQAGQRVIVINVFAGMPEYSQLSAFAREKHAVWGSPEGVVAARRAEDQAALAHLGADVVYWNYLDCIYRRDGRRVLYPGEVHLWGDVDPADGALQERLVADVEAFLNKVSDATCYAPLAIGHHVDHQLVRHVGLALVARGRRVTFYEDFPYVWREEEALSAAVRPGEWKPAVHAINVAPKIAAIACYKSQVLDLFGGEEAMADAVKAYAQMVGGDHCAERFWHVLLTHH